MTSNSSNLGKIDQSYEKAGYIPDNLQALLCPAMAPGFSFRDKLWGYFDVAKLNPIRWTEHPINALQLDLKYRNALSDLVKHYYTHDDKMNDVIVGKGKGLIFLLNGPPGCGKTLTAGKHENLVAATYSFSNHFDQRQSQNKKEDRCIMFQVVS